MAGKLAARVGDLTAHGAPATGVGSPTVLIGGKPAWRMLKDTHTCPIPSIPVKGPDGPEVCMLGSLGVLIEGAGAARMGDQLIGAAPPNAFVLGMATVLIGDIAFGLLDPADLKAFCKEFAALMAKWDPLTPEQRRAELERIVNAPLQKAGVAHVGVNPNPAFVNGAQYDFTRGVMDIPEAMLKSPASGVPAGTLANFVYHEARHAEQWFGVAQRLAGQGMSPAQVLAATGLEKNQVAAACQSPLTGNSPQGALADATHESVYGAGSAERERILKGDITGKDPVNRAKYKALPEEEDAYRTGNALPCGTPIH